MTAVLLVGRLLTTKTSRRLTSPVLRTVPVKVKRPPLNAITAGQNLVTAIPGAVTIGHGTLTAFVTSAKVHMFRPRAVTESGSQKSVGTVYRPE